MAKYETLSEAQIYVDAPWEIDVPELYLKVHVDPIPRSGGLATVKVKQLPRAAIDNCDNRDNDVSDKQAP